MLTWARPRPPCQTWTRAPWTGAASCREDVPRHQLSGSWHEGPWTICIYITRLLLIKAVLGTNGSERCEAGGARPDEEVGHVGRHAAALDAAGESRSLRGGLSSCGLRGGLSCGLLDRLSSCGLCFSDSHGYYIHHFSHFWGKIDFKLRIAALYVHMLFVCSFVYNRR